MILSSWNSPRPVVRRVIAFNRGDPDLGFCEYLAWDRASFEDDAWESHVERLTGFTDVKLEIRVQQGDAKWRVVLFPGMMCNPDFVKPKFSIVRATLMPRHDDATAMDVTRRIRKYVPGNSVLAVRDMFPFDDHEDNAERFRSLVLMDMRMRVFELAL